MSFSLSFGPVPVADIQTAADAAYETWVADMKYADPIPAYLLGGVDLLSSAGIAAFVAGVPDATPPLPAGDPAMLASYRFNEDQKYAAREALRLAVDTVKRGNFGTEHGDAMAANGSLIPADQVSVTASGHGRRYAVRPGDSSATPYLKLEISVPSTAVVGPSEAPPVVTTVDEPAAAPVEPAAA